MKLQLYVENEELELNGTETFPLNQTFENLFNPTDIIVEYSKSINIPVTQKNNKILGNSYRLDREIVGGGTKNIGLYLDPTKRIPMKLMYNGDIVLDGYAKFVSSTSSPKENYYTLNLFGVLGDIFQKLKKVVVSEPLLDSELDNPELYILNDHSTDYSGKETTIDKDFVFDSWWYSNLNLDDPAESNVPIYHIYGMAPTYCGYYPDFDPTRVQYSATQSSLIADELRDSWAAAYCSKKGYNFNSLTDAQKEEVDNYVDALDPEGFVGDGFKDYQMMEYRSYHQRPFIYFNKLMYMFREKISEISDYKLELDSGWFNANNPYWARMCYMFDYIQKGGQESKMIESSNLSVGENVSLGSGTYATLNSNILIPIKNTTSSSTLILDPMTLAIDLKLNKKLSQYSNLPSGRRAATIGMKSDVCLRLTFHCGNSTHYFYSSSNSLTYINNNPSVWPTYWAKPTSDNFLSLDIATENLVNGCKSNVGEDEWFRSIMVPSLAFEGNFGSSKPTMIVTFEIWAPQSKNGTGASAAGQSFFSADNRDGSVHIPIDVWDNTTEIYGKLHYYVLPTTCKSSWSNLPVGLKTFYTQEKPIFDIVLEYTKMFGLVWDVDYSQKTIKLQRRSTLFKDYTIENWESKMDKTQKMVVEPVCFPTQYVKFGYDECDGYRYGAYKKEFGYEYGDKLIKTNYNFNTDETNILEGVKGGTCSNRSFVTYDQSLHWNTTSVIKPSIDPYVRLENASEDDSSPIDVSRWCMRSRNVSDGTGQRIFITDDTALMIAEGKSYYIDYRALVAGTVEGHWFYGLPIFSQVWRDSDISFNTFNSYYSCLFNTPNTDYTKDQLFLQAKGNTVYDLCWNNYINERYNIQNKKVTAYFYITQNEFNRFKFNKLVSLDNQIFMVNKIIDFEPSSNKPTKCELIQISNLDNYTTPIKEFEPIQVNFNKNFPIEDGKYTIYHDDGYFTFSFEIRSYPQATGVLNIIYSDQQYSYDPVYFEDREVYDDIITSFTITGELGDQSIRYIDFEVVLTIGDQTLTLPFQAIHQA